MIMRSNDRQRVRLVAQASCSQQCGGASEPLTDAAKGGLRGLAGGEGESDREKDVVVSERIMGVAGKQSE